MGQDKALLPFLGKPLIERVINRVVSLGDELIITTNRPEKYLNFKLPLFQDLLPGFGALGGLYTALSVCRFPVICVVACDMPFVNTGILMRSFEILEAENADVVVPKTVNGFEPFHAVYRRDKCLPAINDALQSGEKRLISWFSQVSVVTFPESELRLYDPRGLAFMNLNTREDFENAEQLAR